jgi:hypothetical protein
MFTHMMREMFRLQIPDTWCSAATKKKYVAYCVATERQLQELQSVRIASAIQPVSQTHSMFGRVGLLVTTSGRLADSNFRRLPPHVGGNARPWRRRML